MSQEDAAAVPRKKIPIEMWEEIYTAETHHHTESKRRAIELDLTLRAEIVRIGQRHGFTESELEHRGVIEKLSRAEQYFQATA